MQTLFYVALLWLCGLFFARFLGIMKFPDVTGYLVAGLLIGPSVLGLMPKEAVQNLSIINDIALAFIAFSIGLEMDLGKLKSLGSKIIIVTIIQALGAFLLVTLGAYFIFHTGLGFALLLGSISCATAPAATLMVIRQYKAQGDLVDVLIPVVALDDAVCIIAFGISSSMAAALLSGQALNPLTMFVFPVGQILLAILIGIAMGLVYSRLERMARNKGEVLTLTVALVFAGSALALYLNLSSLLLLMTCGLFVANFTRAKRRPANVIDQVTAPIFLLFFVLSGADLDLSALPAVGLLGVFYIVARTIGKYLGAALSTKATGFPPSVYENLGLTLLPQAGVAIGLSALAQGLYANVVPVAGASIFLSPQAGSLIRTIVLGATIVYELIGPILAKLALDRAGTIPHPDKPASKPKVQEIADNEGEKRKPSLEGKAGC